MNKISRTKAAIYAALIFAGGLGTGVVTAPLLGRAYLGPPSPEKMSRRMLSMHEKRLDLNREQVAQIKPIIDKGGENMRAIWLDTARRVSAQLDEINNEIAPLLSPEQKAKLDKFAAEVRERRQKRTVFGHPPPGL